MALSARLPDEATPIDVREAPLPEPELDFENDRDATLKLIDWFDIERVRAAKVLVVGAGAIGNEVLKNLALLGVGHVHILDQDTIELSNLSRSILYRPHHRGLPKAQVAAQSLKEINPAINVYWRVGNIASALGEGLLRRMDVVIGCLDNIDARYLLNRLCWRAGTPWVDAGIGALNGQVRVYVPPDGPCYECSFSTGHYGLLSSHKPCNALASVYASQGHVPTTPTIASIVAAVQVQECLKLLDAPTWRDRSLSGREFIFNGTNPDVDIVRMPRRDDCPAHVSIDADQLFELPEMTVAVSAARLLESACERLGASAHLYLESEIALQRKCAACGNLHPLFRPVNKLYREELDCVCGHPSRWESDLITSHVVSRDSAPELLETTLAALGVPQGGIVEARGAEGELLYLELTGDIETIMEPWL